MGQFLKDFGELLAVIIIPFAVYFTGISLQKRKEKREAKMNLFLTLIETRKVSPPLIEYIKALNSIDIVFQDSPKVREKWKAYYYSLHERSEHFGSQTHFQLELLSTIAHELGYNNIEQVDIDRFYFDASYTDAQKKNQMLHDEMFRAYYNSEHLGEPRKDKTLIQ